MSSGKWRSAYIYIADCFWNFLGHFMELLFCFVFQTLDVRVLVFFTGCYDKGL